MNESLLKAAEYFVSVVAQLTVLFISISIVIELILMYIPQEKINAWLSKRGIVGNFLGAVLGALTPF